MYCGVTVSMSLIFLLNYLAEIKPKPCFWLVVYQFYYKSPFLFIHAAKQAYFIDIQKE